MLLFNVVVPTRPRYAVIAALLSVTAVPAMVLLSLSMFPPESRPTAGMIFFGFGFGYLLVVIMAYVGARVVYGLGTEVTRARELGSYRLEHRLGQGGMGEVWSASHRLLARPAAIKLIRPSVPGSAAAGSDDMRRRFEREAQVIAQLRSPHTVTLFDFGVAEEGSYYSRWSFSDSTRSHSRNRGLMHEPGSGGTSICHSSPRSPSASLGPDRTGLSPNRRPEAGRRTE